VGGVTPPQTTFAGGDVVVDGTLRRGDVVVADGRIVEIVESGSAPGPRPSGGGHDAEPASVVDCSGSVIAPGFIDLQCNGAVGLDITSDPSCIPDVARSLPRFGVTAFLPTVVTSPAATRQRAIDTMQAEPPAPDGAAALGLHVEGPLIAPTRLGAHPAHLVVDADALGLHVEGPLIAPTRLGAHPAHLVVDADALAAEIDRWVESDVVRLVTLAPELPGALAVIGRLRAGGIVVSAGHTEMTPDDLAAARAAGVSWVTHLFNAMAPFGHRSPGSVGAVLADDAVVGGLICDGIHVDPVAVRAAWRALGAGRVTLVSDASPALGAPFGRFDLGGFEVIHDETGVRTRDGVLAGSALPLDRAVRNLVEYTGCSLVEAIEAATSVPADLLGLTDRGRVAAGCRADLALLDPSGELRATIVGGRCVHGDLPSGSP